MAEKLSITIGLEGGKELERQLADIGEAGQKAFLDIAKAAEKAGGFKNLRPEEVTAKLKEMGVVGVEALNKIQNAVTGAARIEQLVSIMRGVETGFASLGAAAVGFARVLGGIAAVAAAAFAEMVKGARDAAEAISKIDAAAIKAGTSVEQFDRMRQGLEQAGLAAKDVDQALAGISKAADAAKLSAVTKAIEGLTKASTDAGTAMRERPADLRLLKEAADGVGPAADKAREALQKLGVTKPPGTAWMEVMRGTARTLQEFIQKTGDAVTGVAAFVESLRTMPDSANRSALAIDAFGEAGAKLVQALRAGLITEDQFKERLGTLGQEAANTSNLLVLSINQMISAWERFKITGDVGQLIAMWTAFGNAASAALSLIAQGLGPLASKMLEFASAIPSYVWEGFKVAATTALDSIVAGIGVVIGKIGELASALGGAIWDTFAQAGVAAWNAITGAISAAIDALMRFLGLKGQAAPGGLTAAPGNARGGLIGGRGTGTSDSNLSWVSRGEHIMPARAVRQPGVLAFLEALRRSGGNLSRVLDRMGHFAMGGPVGLPAFAAGGVGGGMSHVTIQFPGGPSIGGLRATADVVEELRKAAVMAQVRSGGRKPSRYS